MTMKTDSRGQAIVEYAVVVFAMVLAFMFVITEFCAAFDTYLKGIYFVIFNPLP